MKLGIYEIKKILIGVILACVICTAITAVLTHMNLTERIGEKGTELGINLAIVVSTLFGGLLSAKGSNAPVIRCMSMTAVLFGIMLVSAFFVDGAFRNTMLRIASLGIGCAVTCTILLKTRNNGKKRNKRYR